jgi:hypothetical protein
MFAFLSPFGILLLVGFQQAPISAPLARLAKPVILLL